VPRTLTLTPRFLARRTALGVTSGPAAIAIRATLGALTRDPLPGAQDAETLMPPVARYWFRRVPGQNLWVYFAFSETELIVVTLSPRPPVPITD
jgi:Txe/YoeB family toxin of Txe-Axe toxin-antitoxin module